MKTSIVSLAIAATFFAMVADAQHQHSGSASGNGADAVPGSNRNPSPGAVPRPGQGQGAGMGGQSGGHMMGGQGGHMMGSMGGSMEGMFDQMDRNKDGLISREEWNAMHGGGASASGSTEHEGHHPATPGSSR